MHPHNYNRLHQDRTVQKLLKLRLSFSEHEKNLPGRNSMSYQVSTQSENLLYSPHIWYEYFCLEQGSNNSNTFSLKCTSINLSPRKKKKRALWSLNLATSSHLNMLIIGCSSMALFWYHA